MIYVHRTPRCRHGFWTEVKFCPTCFPKKARSGRRVAIEVPYPKAGHTTAGVLVLGVLKKHSLLCQCHCGNYYQSWESGLIRTARAGGKSSCPVCRPAMRRSQRLRFEQKRRAAI